MEEAIKIAILGDICPTKDYRKFFDSQDPEQVLGGAVNRLKEADLTIANLEAPATESNEPIMKTGPNLKALPRDLETLQKGGIDVFSMANNHILDYGTQGVIDTLETCEKLGIRTVGSGRDSKAAKEPLFIPVKDKMIGILSFAEAEFNLATSNQAGANRFDYFDSIKDIDSAKKNCDFLIVLYHGGSEHYPYPSPLLQKKCRNMAEFGADLVICQHSHCIGTYEEVNGSTILYGQGNAVFGWEDGDQQWNEGLLVEITIIGAVKPQIRFILLNANADGVGLANENKAGERLRRMNEMSKALQHSEQVNALWEDFSHSHVSLYYSMLFGKGRIFNKINRLLKNRLIDFLYSDRERMLAMNMLRCDAHNEVIQTILKQNFRKKQDNVEL
ncbi:CapA family protein [Planococcus shenhongbingii]|uniref:CapA family protein n=1 Tax=Planococcus shenhongbingii TaxID=3058398 RepID=UPI002630743A|nr:CapA family protein [Planococcus sp. N016]WKA57758.1 CapA family protein [Planococcus sp. N016]